MQVAMADNTIHNRHVYNGLVRMDGLVMKNRLGIAGYIKNESFQRMNTYNSCQNNILTNTHTIKYRYANIYMDFMLAPKFHLTAQKLNKKDHVISPAIAVGFNLKEHNSINEYAGVYAGLAGGIQLKNTKIIADYSPNLSKIYGSSGLFISANFLLQPKSKSYR